MTIIAFTGWVAALILALLLIAEIRDHAKTGKALTAMKKQCRLAEASLEYWKGACEHEAGERLAAQTKVIKQASRIIDLERRLAVAERKPARDAKGHFVGKVQA